jgi:hypothetical protein
MAGTGRPAAGAAQLLHLYRQIDELASLGWRAPRCRRWQAETLSALRATLGFHPAVVQFQGLRFRAGPVTASPDDLASIPDARHDERLHADLQEARRLLRKALADLGVDADAAPAAAPAAAAAPAPPSAGAIVAAAEGDVALSAADRAAVAQEADRLARACAAQPADWGAVAAPLGQLLHYGPAVGRAAVALVAARLPPAV